MIQHARSGTKNLVVGLLAALTLPLVACGDDQSGGRQDVGPTTSEDTTDTSSSSAGDAADGGPGTYEFEANGATGSIKIPVPTTDERVLEVEDFRTKVGAEPAVYVLVEVDNTGGEETVDITDIEVVTEDGQQATIEPVWSLIGDWQELIPAEDDSGIYNVGVDLYNANLGQGDVLPGAKSSIIYATSNVAVEVPKRVFITAGYDQVEATKGS